MRARRRSVSLARTCLARACLARSSRLLALPVALSLGACSVPDEVNPVLIYRRISGEAEAGRLPPPGMDDPRPNLASVPPRPERPPPEVRDAISAALAADRAASRAPLDPRASRAAATAALGGMPAAPPPRAALGGAPAIPWQEAVPAAVQRSPNPGPAPSPGPTRARAPEPAAPPPAALPEMPDEAPAPPPPDLLGQPRRP